MADLLDEIKQDIKDEKVEKVITEHGSKLLILAALILVLSGGYIFYKKSQKQESERIGKIFYEAVADSDIEKYDEVIEQGHKGFSELSYLFQAGSLNSRDEQDQAIINLQKFTDDSAYDSALRQKAELDIIYMKLTSNQFDLSQEEISKLDRIIDTGGTFSLLARDIKVYYLFLNNKVAEVKPILEQAINDDSSAPTLRTRYSILLSALENPN